MASWHLNRLRPATDLYNQNKPDVTERWWRTQWTVWEDMFGCCFKLERTSNIHIKWATAGVYVHPLELLVELTSSSNRHKPLAGIHVFPIAPQSLNHHVLSLLFCPFALKFLLLKYAGASQDDLGGVMWSGLCESRQGLSGQRLETRPKVVPGLVWATSPLQKCHPTTIYKPSMTLGELGKTEILDWNWSNSNSNSSSLHTHFLHTIAQLSKAINNIPNFNHTDSLARMCLL